MKLVIHTDGGARGNPGPAAVGVEIKIYKSGQSTEYQKIEVRQRIGEATNNVAEYTAVKVALSEVERQLAKFPTPEKEQIEIIFFLDSTLVVNQLNGIFKIKEPALRSLMMDVRLLEQQVGGVVSYTYVPREKNRVADYLVNKALDDL